MKEKVTVEGMTPRQAIQDWYEYRKDQRCPNVKPHGYENLATEGQPFSPHLLGYWAVEEAYNSGLARRVTLVEIALDCKGGSDIGPDMLRRAAKELTRLNLAVTEVLRSDGFAQMEDYLEEKKRLLAID